MKELISTLETFLTHTSATVTEVFMLGMQVLEGAGAKRRNCVKRAQEMIRLGAEALAEQEKSVSVAEAIKDMLENKKERVRPVTMKGLKTLTNRLLKSRPDLAKKQIRALKTEQCLEWLAETFKTPRLFINGRSALSSVFSHAIRRGWAAENKVMYVDKPPCKEGRITALPLNDCKLLLKLATEKFNGECLPAVAMLMYAGIRPAELRRLKTQNICLEENVISIPARHSKTGGSRHVNLQAPLRKIISATSFTADTPIIPKNWERKWRIIRSNFMKQTGKSLAPDILRHTFASYHAKRFANFPALQMDMGHSNANQLRTRYLNMDGIGRDDAKEFWMAA